MTQSQQSVEGQADGGMEVTAIRSMYELPYLAQFLTLNKDKFDFPAIDTEILEKSLVLPQDLLLSDIFARILRHHLQNTSIRHTSFETHLSELLVSRSASWNPLSNSEYKTISAADRLKLLKWLADETKEKKAEVNEFLSEEFNSAADRLEDKEINVGKDSDNRTYWYFHDLRLYRSKSSPQSKEGAADWQCVAITLDEWQSLIRELEKSKNEQEKELYTYLNDQLFLPSIRLGLENKASGAVANVQRPTDDEIKAKEESDIMKMQAANTTDPKANPELTKVLNEEPSSNVPKDHDKHREEHSRKSGDERKAEFNKNGNCRHGSTKLNQESNQSSQQHGMKPPHASSASMKMPYSSVNGTNSTSFPPQSTNPLPNHPSWNGQRPPMPGYTDIRPESSGMWGPVGPTNQSELDISHNIVPDENLTPEQRQNRENGMASLRKIHEMLMDPQMQQVTDFSHINMAQDRQGPVGPHMQHPIDDFGVYGPGGAGPPMGPGGTPIASRGPPMSHAGPMVGPNGQPMPGGPPMGPGGHPMGPGGPPIGPGGPTMGPGPMMGPGGQPLGPGMMMPGHPHPHSHHMSGTMGPGPMSAAGHPHMSPNGPVPPHMAGGPHVDMGMYSAGPPNMPSKPPPPYQAPMSAPAPETPAPRTSKSKKRKSSTQSPAPQSPLGQSLKSPKYQIPPSPLTATPQGIMPGMGPGFPGSEPGMPPTGHSQMYKGPHGSAPPHSSQQGNLMQAGPPEPFQGHPASGSASHKPPPSYSQSTNNKRGLESMATPPAQKQYYTQFENKELRIIKQPNTAYQSPDSTESNQFGAQSGRHPGPGSPMNSHSNLKITSSTLANLAKGVEQIQQNMVEGGPFRDLQQQPGPQPGQQPAQQPGVTPAIASGPVPMSSSANQSSAGPNAIPATSGSAQPSVNNTFVNAHMSIGQVNIQNVNASQQHAGFDSAGRPTQMQQNVDVTMNTGGMTSGAPHFSSEEPNFPPTNPSTTNSVKVQAKGGNTLQYLPVSHPAALPPANEPVVQKPQSFDFGRNESFATPLPNLDSKTPTSKISYYPDNSRLPPPPPQRLPQSVNCSIPQAHNHAGLPQYSGMTMHPTPAPHMSPGMPPSHAPPMSQFTSAHPNMPPVSSVYSPPSGLYGPMAPPLGQEAPPNIGMMDPMHSPHGHPGAPMMMGHMPPHQGAHMPAHPAMMPQSHSPFNPPGPMDFSPAPHGAHPGFPGDFPPGAGHMGISRQISHPGHPGMPPQHMMISPQGAPYVNGPGPGTSPYMMGGM
ncbi:uncharacterized protein [Watersipora subatra]|uniref:uncharacterized protein isoform X2 n=1 Tax=Watersipora subatra TaxID=2589382 RepID=UPI00355B4CB2